MIYIEPNFVISETPWNDPVPIYPAEEAGSVPVVFKGVVHIKDVEKNLMAKYIEGDYSDDLEWYLIDHEGKSYPNHLIGLAKGIFDEIVFPVEEPSLSSRNYTHMYGLMYVRGDDVTKPILEVQCNISLTPEQLKDFDTSQLKWHPVID